MFLVTCAKCLCSTKVDVKTSNNGKIKYYYLQFSNDLIIVENVGYDGEIGIKCACGNKIEEGLRGNK